MTDLEGSNAGGTGTDPERAELERYLRNDETRLGDVYRGLERGLEAVAIADELGVSTSNFVWNNQRVLGAILDRELPTAPTVAAETARKFRTLLKRTWSPAVQARLEADLERLERRATDVEAIADEAVSARQQTAAAEQSDTVGIYVYSLPHYLRYPFDPESARTLLKVGRSDRDVIQRMRDQTRTTALPEEPVLLRIYPTGSLDSPDVESRFHKTLRAFDHGRAVERMAGREWFLTTTQALDAIAALLGLEPVIVNEDGDFATE